MGDFRIWNLEFEVQPSFPLNFLLFFYYIHPEIKLPMYKFFYLLPLSLLPSCGGESIRSDKTDPNSIYQKYKASYKDKNLFLETEFLVNAEWDRLEYEKYGDHVELTAPAKITFNGKEMTKETNIFTGAQYSFRQQGSVPEELVWEWTDNSGKKYVNTISIKPISLNKIPGHYTEKGDYIVEWSGDPVGEEEKVIVAVEGKDYDKREEKHYYEISTSRSGDTKLTITKGELLNFSPGDVTITVQRSKNLPVKEGTAAGGNILIDYTSEERSVIRPVVF